MIDEDQVEHGVWGEPALSQNLAGAIPDDALTYDRWLAKNVARTSRESTWRNTLLIAIAAGPWSILGALASQMAAGKNAIIMACVIAPISEEIMKAAASLWVIEKRPFLFSSKSQILLCAAIAGLCFAAIENVMYLKCRLERTNPRLGDLAMDGMHVVARDLCSDRRRGPAKVWGHTMTTQTRPNISLATPYFFAAMLLHGLYNAGATIYSLSQQ